MIELKKKVHTLVNTELSKFKTKVNSMDEQRINSMEEKIKLFEHNFYRTEQSEGQDRTVLSGEALPDASSDENCRIFPLNIFREHLRLNIADDDVSSGHHIGKKPTTGTDKQSIILKVCRLDVVPDICTECKKQQPIIYVPQS